MELRAIVLTLLILGGAGFAFGYALKPAWLRVWKYLCALKAQDEEMQRDAKEIERLRIEALRELESEPEQPRNQNVGKSNSN